MWEKRRQKTAENKTKIVAQACDPGKTKFRPSSTNDKGEPIEVCKEKKGKAKSIRLKA